MIRSPTKSLAQLLASDGHDDDDIFVARAIAPVSPAGGSTRGSGDEGRSQTGAIRMEGGVDYHKFNMKAALLRNLAGNQEEGGADEDNADSGQGEGAPDIEPPGIGVPDTPAGDDGTDPGDDDTGGTDTDDTDPAVDMTITGTVGNDILSGGDGIDTFVFAPDGGHDVITNFDVGTDVLDLRAYGFASLDDALSHAVADGAGLALVIGANRIVLQDVTFAQAQDLAVLFA